MSEYYSIKDLERISGIKAHTLRIWEQRYGILRPERTSTNIRLYSGSELKKLLNIALLNNKGIKISRIARMSEEEIHREVERLFSSMENESEQVESLTLSLMEMNEARFEQTINGAIEHFGFENTFEKVVFPFLRRLGNMWQIGIVTPAQEHYISNMVRQKLIVGIDRLRPVQKENPSTLLFFLPNTELHELGLLHAYYLARARGHKCVYLGQCVPVEDIISIAKTVKPDILVGMFTTSIPPEEVKEVLRQCSEKISGSRILISGRLFFSTDEKIDGDFHNVRIFSDYNEYRQLLPA